MANTAPIMAPLKKTTSAPLGSTGVCFWQALRVPCRSSAASCKTLFNHSGENLLNDSLPPPCEAVGGNIPSRQQHTLDLPAPQPCSEACSSLSRLPRMQHTIHPSTDLHRVWKRQDICDVIVIDLGKPPPWLSNTSAHHRGAHGLVCSAFFKTPTGVLRRLPVLPCPESSSNPAPPARCCHGDVWLGSQSPAKHSVGKTVPCESCPRWRPSHGGTLQSAVALGAWDKEASGQSDGTTSVLRTSSLLPRTSGPLPGCRMHWHLAACTARLACTSVR